MGLFGSKLNCPVCGGPVKGLVTTKIKDSVVICGTCTRKIAMPGERLLEQSVEDIKEHLAYREENKRIFSQFKMTKEVKVGFFRLRVDENLKKWYTTYVQIDKSPSNPPLYGYEDVLGYEFEEDGEKVITTEKGSAVMGGVLFGEVGAVVGGVTGDKKIKTAVKSMKVKVTLNNKYCDQLIVECLPYGAEYKTDSILYKSYREDAQKVMDVFDSMGAKKKEKSKVVINSTSAPISGADELLKYKSLFDMGVLTQEEFDAKKKQILGL